MLHGWIYEFEVLNTNTALANLSAAMTGGTNPSVNLGSNLTFIILVTNHGPSTASGVRLDDPLPSGVQFISGSSGCTFSNGMVTCQLDALTNGAVATVVIVVKPTCPCTIRNSATVVASENDLNLLD